MLLDAMIYEQLAQVRSIMETALCWAIGHNRSGGAAFQAGDDWYSGANDVIGHCGAMLQGHGERSPTSSSRPPGYGGKSS